AEVGGRKPNDGDEVEKSMGDRPMVVEAGTSSRPEELEMDSESSLSVSSVRSRRLWRRHSQSIDNCSLRSSDTDEPPPKAPTTDGRGRGRSTPTPTTGKYVGIKKAQQERGQAEEGRGAKEGRRGAGRAAALRGPNPVRANCAGNCEKVRKSKGHVTKALNRVINIITRYVQQPESAAITRLEEERKKWRENSARLEESVKRLEEENSSLRRRLEDLEASNNSRTTTEEMLAMVEARVQARLESALMGPAQRPSLAHERKAASGTHSSQCQEAYSRRNQRATAANCGTLNGARHHTGTPRRSPEEGSNQEDGTGAKGRREKKGPVQASPEPRPLPPAPTSMETPWVVVASRKSKKTKPAVPPKKVQAQQQARRTEPKVRPPRSAAVIISLTTAAVAKGLSYKQVLTDAQTRVDLTGLDISRLKPKRFRAKPMEGVARSSVATEVDRTRVGVSLPSGAGGSGEGTPARSTAGRFLNSDTDEPVPKAQSTDGRGGGRAPTSRPPLPVWKRRKWRENSERLEAKRKAARRGKLLPPPSARGPGSVKQPQDHHGEMLAMVEGTGGRPAAQDQEGERERQEETASAHPTPAPVAGPSSAPLQDIAGPSTAAAGSSTACHQRKQAKPLQITKQRRAPSPKRALRRRHRPLRNPAHCRQLRPQWRHRGLSRKPEKEQDQRD
ncbi:MAP7 domain-containing protein 1-like, partial [Manduca sexta]|uniref:MAP7 domain-containing protein 1-like n=1 Tax=Manduca sexta TaxID=7130 RepID=UPI00188E20FF